MKHIKILLILSLLLTGCFSNNKASDDENVTNTPSIAVVYVTIKDNMPVNRLEKENQEARFKVVYTDGTTLEVLPDEEGNYPMTIKGRGNSTWGVPTTKKPYNLKFNDKIDLFGLGEAKKWSLLAGWFDTSFLRSYIGYTLSKTLDETTPDFEMVNLFINDKYEGIYMFCEAYGINKHRVETKGDGKDVNNDGEITEYLIEADARAEENDEPNRILTPSSNWLVVKEPDEDEILSETDERFVYIKDLIDKADQAIVNRDGYEQYIDLDSLASQYVVNEYLKNQDYCYGSQSYYYGSTFMYLEEGGKIYFGPFWDCDFSLGRTDYSEIESEGFRETSDSQGYLAKQSHWISQLMEEEAFVEKVKEKWTLLKPEVEKMIDEKAPQMLEKIKPYIIMDFQVHNETYNKRTTDWCGREPLDYYEEYRYVIKFMKERLTWMDQQFG